MWATMAVVLAFPPPVVRYYSIVGHSAGGRGQAQWVCLLRARHTHTRTRTHTHTQTHKKKTQTQACARAHTHQNTNRRPCGHSTAKALQAGQVTPRRGPHHGPGARAHTPGPPKLRASALPVAAAAVVPRSASRAGSTRLALAAASGDTDDTNASASTAATALGPALSVQ